jgi:hypothetical protein
MPLSSVLPNGQVASKPQGARMACPVEAQADERKAKMVRGKGRIWIQGASTKRMTRVAGIGGRSGQPVCQKTKNASTPMVRTISRQMISWSISAESRYGSYGNRGQ